MIRTLAVAAIALWCTPAPAEDFLAIHMNNQKIGSPIADYWRAETAAAQPDEYMAIHMNNQKVGSSVVAFWKAYAAGAKKNRVCFRSASRRPPYHRS